MLGSIVTKLLPSASLCLLLVSASCRSLAEASAPDKVAETAETPQATRAKQAFESALFAGDYAALDPITRQLTAAYLTAPRDPTLTLYLAHAHFWRVAERAREPTPNPLLTDHLLLAQGYFRQARQLRPSDHRILGWLGGVTMALGKVHADEHWLREGYFTLEDGVAAFPEFNHFSKSYVLSSLPRSHPRFEEALDSLWESVELCNARAIDHERPDFSAFFRRSDESPRVGPLRVCHNLEKAPHNFEGFFLHNGDLLVKAGKPTAAKLMYANARLEPSFRSWAYRDVLEQRIASAEARARAFDSPDPAAWPEMMVTSQLACTGCHQR